MPDFNVRSDAVNVEQIMEQIRARVDAVVHDPKTAAALKPYYPYGCKRPTFHDESFRIRHEIGTVTMGPAPSSGTMRTSLSSEALRTWRPLGVIVKERICAPDRKSVV